MRNRTEILGGFTEPELTRMILVGSGELVNDPHVVALCGGIESYMRDDEGRTFYDAVLRDLNDGAPAEWKRRVIKVLIDSLGIWLPDNYYQGMPVIRPYVIRDPRCRQRMPGTNHDEWSMPDAHGYLRDDNSLIKAVVRAMSVAGWKVRIPDGTAITGGFTASHVWRMGVDYEAGDDLVSRDPDLNSFVPNLVWLPTELSKMTDREGSFAQRYIQALSCAIFRDQTLPPGLRQKVDEIWRQLPFPGGIGVPLPDLGALPRFVACARLIENKIKDVNVVARAVDSVLRGETLPRGRGAVTARYSAGIGGVARESLNALFVRLRGYAEMLGSYDPDVALHAIRDSDEDEAEVMEQQIPIRPNPSEATSRSRTRATRAGGVVRQADPMKAAHQVRVRLMGYLAGLTDSSRDVRNLCSSEYTHATFGIPTYSVLAPLDQHYERRRYYKENGHVLISGTPYAITLEWHKKNLLLLKQWLDARGVAP